MYADTDSKGDVTMRMPDEIEGALTMDGRDCILTIPVETSISGSRMTVTISKPASVWKIRPVNGVYDNGFFKIKDNIKKQYDEYCKGDVLCL